MPKKKNQHQIKFHPVADVLIISDIQTNILGIRCSNPYNINDIYFKVHSSKAKTFC